MRIHHAVTGALALSTMLATTALAGDERPMFARFPSRATTPAASVPTFTYKWIYKGTTYTATIVGNNPHIGASLTVPVYIFPVSLTSGSTTFSALDKDALGNGTATVLDDTIASPIFSSAVDFKSGGVDFGSTQYIDAYARGDLYNFGIKTNSKYHVLLGTPTVEPLQAYTVPAADGRVTTDFGVKVINADINWFDSTVIQPAIKKYNLPADAYALFITTQTYLTSGGCCIGGYHTQAANGTTYAHATYIQKAGVFSQDVSALSHETGEWQLDPFTNNTSSPCGGLLENGDPLEGTANYGDYPYAGGNGITYHLQDLVYLPYFGSPSIRTVNKQFTFQGTHLLVCQNGQ